MRASWLCLVAGAALFSFAAIPASAQGTPTAVVIRVRVTDSAQTPIPGAEISLVRGLNQVVAAGAADRGGLRGFLVEYPDSGFQVVVRKVGFARFSQFTRIAGRDTVDVTAVLQRAAQQIAGVNVTAEQNTKRAAQFIDAESIAASDRPLADALDIILKLRPGMIWGVRGPPVMAKVKCDPLTNVWVNGSWIRDAPPNELMETRKRLAIQGHEATKPLFGGVPTLTPPPLALVPRNALSVLGSIKPEHVETMEYHDCADVSMPQMHSSSAVFITLKTGVAFEPGIGSFVPDSSQSGAGQPTAAAVARLLPADERYRARLLGLFDSANGNPIAAADVTEVATGAKARTSATGTVSLAFMRDGGGVISVSKVGYVTDTMTVVLSPSDTAPVTMLLQKR